MSEYSSVITSRATAVANRRIGAIAISLAGALALAGCGGGDTDGSTAASPSPSPSVSEGPAFTVTSTDFTDGADLPLTAKASAFGNQCTGENINPQLEWANAPEGTESFAVLILDPDAGSTVHWSKVNIPTDITEVPTGGADAIPGIGGVTGNTNGLYFGPCPPRGVHHYTFTVYALDAELELEPGFELRDFYFALGEHVLAEATITGLASPD